ncbi:MAG: argS [Nitrososphaeraceae archaeon]|nr:argS [Nitrososphaeraceae archaeon]MDF2767600.1 argS [Nitrososphaeraceae archaeon]
MTFRLLINEIRQAVSNSLINLNYVHQDFDISESPRKEFGDLSCNVAFLLSKALRRRPVDIANEIIEKELKPYIEKKKATDSISFILSVESHPSGYINFKANISNLASWTLNEVLKNSKYGFNDLGKGKRIIIEHTSINPNKALHVGHMRNVVIGDILYRTLRATNHEVIVLNYIDDSGLQVADIVVGFRFAGLPLYPKDKTIKFDQYCGDEVYVKINEMYKDDKYLEEKRRLVLKEIELGTSEIAKFASEITMRVLKDQLKTCWRMKAHYDLLNYESHIVTSRLWSKTFEMLKEKGIATLQTEGKNKYCWVIKLENEEEKVIVRSDGTATYIAKDIPYAAWKLGLVEDPFFYHKFADQWDESILWATTLNPNAGNLGHPTFNSGEKVITIIDSRQARLQRIIATVLSHLQTNNDRYIHLAYEAMTLSADTAKSLGLDIGDRQFMHISGRKGIYINADYILDKLQTTAYQEVRKRNPDISNDITNMIAEEISISAIRYNLIKQDLDKIITFDIVDSLSLEGNTGPYLQYTYARSQRILEKYGNKNVSSENFGLLIQEAEVDLIKTIAKMDLVIEETVKTLNPKLLARYAYDLATAFNIFYEKVPVLREKNKETMFSRLALVKAFGVTLNNIFNVLGISALENM